MSNAMNSMSHLLRTKPQDFLRTWTAHLSLVAAAAQQLHRGTPHQVFQVGGREKLVNVMEHLVTDVMGVLQPKVKGDEAKEVAKTDANASPSPSVFKKLAEAIIHEIFELSESVFQGADRVAVVSFVQCLCSEIASACRMLEVNFEDDDDVCEFRRIFELDESVPRGTEFSLPLDFRQLLFDKLQSGYRSQGKNLIAHYLVFLCTGVDTYHETTPVVPQRLYSVSNLGTVIKHPR